MDARVIMGREEMGYGGKVSGIINLDVMTWRKRVGMFEDCVYMPVYMFREGFVLDIPIGLCVIDTDDYVDVVWGPCFMMRVDTRGMTVRGGMVVNHLFYMRGDKICWLVGEIIKKYHGGLDIDFDDISFENYQTYDVRKANMRMTVSLHKGDLVGSVKVPVCVRGCFKRWGDLDSVESVDKVDWDECVESLNDLRVVNWELMKGEEEVMWKGGLVMREEYIRRMKATRGYISMNEKGDILLEKMEYGGREVRGGRGIQEVRKEKEEEEEEEEEIEDEEVESFVENILSDNICNFEGVDMVNQDNDGWGDFLDD